MATIKKSFGEVFNLTEIEEVKKWLHYVSYGILKTFCCVKIRCVTVFDGVHPVLLRMSRYVTVITAREVYRYKMAYHGDKFKFIHIGSVTIVNNIDHTLHYATEEEIKSRAF